MKTIHNYNIVSLHDQLWHPSWDMPLPVSHNQEWQSASIIPNAPQSARHTYLADLLRAGLTPAQCEHRSIRDIRCNRQAPIQPMEISPKRTQSLLGKLLGIEIEFYPSRYGLPKENGLTRVVPDSSLDCDGEEVRRITWVSRSGRLEGLLSLKFDGRVNSKCGLHVHVDARHLGSNGLLSPFMTYQRLLAFQKFLKKLVPKSRLRNRYCRWKDNSATGDRYSAINYLAFERHGTIEFRCQGGTTNKLKIEMWALLCQFLLNYCATERNPIPSNWAKFLAILPSPIGAWCAMRHEKLYGNLSRTERERILEALV